MLAASLAVIWSLLVVAGYVSVVRYGGAASTSGSSPTTWPAGSELNRVAEWPTLILFAHPRCPCTRASIRELAVLMAGFQGRVTAHVVFLDPDGTDEDWTTTDLWHSARRIPGVSAVRDRGARESRLFGIETSGHVLLYDRKGRLEFEGGITASRGHEGDNAGRQALGALLDLRDTDRRSTPVFGCPLRESRTDAAAPGRESSP